MNSDRYTTRPQLRGYGATQYQARAVTQKLAPTGKENKAYTYALPEVINSVRKYLKNPRLKAKTRQNLEALLTILLNRLNNVIEVSFCHGTDPELSKLTKRLFSAMREADFQLAELKATAATVKGKS